MAKAPTSATQSLPSDEIPMTLDDFLNAMYVRDKTRVPSLAGFGHEHKTDPRRSFSEWMRMYDEFLRKPLS